jgi:hydrogenase nickel incorporation protein HypA/HybF
LHELAIAQSIAESAAEEAGRAKAKRVASIEVEVGELMQLDVEALRQALKMLMAGPILKDAKVHVRVSSASFVCNRCGERWGMPEARRQLALVADELRVREPDSVELPLHFLPHLYPAFVKCPKCGSADSEAVEGEDIVLRRVVME